MGWAAAIPMAMSAISGMVGDKQSQFGTSKTTPTIGTQYEPMLNMLYKQYMQNLNKSLDMGGYQASGIQSINSTFDLAKLVRQNELTRRGLSTSPVAAMTDAVGETGRAGTISQFQNSLPMVERQLKQTDYDNMMALINRLMGSSTSTNGSATQGGGVGGGFQSAADMFAYLYGKGAFGSSGSSKVGSAVSLGREP